MDHQNVHTQGPSVNNLFPSIAQSFVIILIGYLFGRFKIISPSDSHSIGSFVGKLALPALLFKNLAVIDLKSVSWCLIAGILIAKAVIFFAVAICTFFATRPFNLGKAGIFAICSVHSNDLAIGLPIVTALYGSSGGFDYVAYLYLFAPVTLLFLNPIGFAMLEYWKERNKSEHVLNCRSIAASLARVFRNVAINPFVFTTVLGLLVNVIMTFGIRRELPSWLTGFLDILGDAYAACALFAIGIFMVGRLQRLAGSTLVVSGVLIIAKSVLLPIVADQTVHWLIRNGSENASAEELSTFSFLYCTFPAAPTVFIFASQYKIAMEIAASSVVFGTILSAPIMYLSARMVSINTVEESHFSRIIEQTRLDISVVSVVGILWVYFIFLLSKKYKSYTHIIVMHIMAAVVFMCIGGQLLDHTENEPYWQYLSFCIFFPSVMASRMWTAWLALSLFLIVVIGPHAAEKAWLPFLFSGWGIPLLLTMIIICVSSATSPPVDVSFLFGNTQLILSFVVLVAVFFTGSAFLGLMFIVARKRRKKTLINGSTCTSENANFPGSPTKNKGELTSSIHSSYQHSGSSLHVQQGIITPWEYDLNGTQLSKFVILLLLLLFSCLVGIMIVVWKLTYEEITGVYVAVNVLDTVTNYGQGFFIFIVLAFEKNWFWNALYRKIRQFFFHIEEVVVLSEEELSPSVKNICNTFKTHHIQHCKESIVSDKRYLLRVYESVFTGCDLVDWLIENHLAISREDAVHYGTSLLSARVIAHVLEEHYFYDEPLFYKFLK